MAVVILVVQSMDACALIYALCVLRFTIKSRKTVAKNWPYFVAFAYSVVVSKYALYTVTSFNPDHGNTMRPDVVIAVRPLFS